MPYTSFSSHAIAELSEDFTLPDYFPEIRRVLSSSNSVSVEGKYSSDTFLEVDGSVTYSILYLTADKSLAQTSHTSPFTAKIKIPPSSPLPPQAFLTTSSVDSSSCRVLSPRKLNLSSKVSLSAAAAEQKNVTMDCPPDLAPRLLKKSHTSASVCELRAEGECSGELREHDLDSIIAASANICTSDVRLSENKVRFSGEAYLTLLLKDKNNHIYTSRTRTPVTHELPMPDNIDEKTACAAFPTVTMTEITADDDILHWSMEYAVDFDLAAEHEDEVAVDAFLPDRDSEELTITTIPTMNINGVASGRLTFGGRIKMEQDSKHVFSFGSGEVDSVSSSCGKVTVAGHVNLCSVVEKDGEYTIIEENFPVKYESESRFSCDGEEKRPLKSMIQVCDVNAREDGDGLNLTAELSVSVFSTVESEINQVGGIVPTGGERKNCDNVIRVYIPDDDEDDWSVEKKFRLKNGVTREGGVYII